MPRLVTIYGLLWMVLLASAPLACIYGLTKAPTPETSKQTRGICLLGFLISVWLAFCLAATTLQPLALMVLFAVFVFMAGIFRPSILELKGVRIYLISCMVVGELFWIYVAWDYFVRVRS
jgi:hypothetical protein